MKSVQLKFGRIKLFDIRTLINLFSFKPALILITSLCAGYLLGCSGDISGPEINFPGGGTGIRSNDFTAEKTFETELPVDNHIRVNLEAINGEIVVTGDNNANSVWMVAHLYVSSDSQKDAQTHLDDLKILVTDSVDEILIQTVQPQNTGGRQYRVAYDIVVPGIFEVVTTQDNGSIAILDIENNVEVSNTSGDVVLSGIVGGVAAGVDNGSIEGTVVLPLNETIDISINNGSLELSIPTSTSAEFSASVVNGEIGVSNLDITVSENTKHTLIGVIGDGEGTIDLSTITGNIEVIGFD